MKLSVKRCYCLVDENENIISSWDIIEERENYIICSKKYKEEGLLLCCYQKDTEAPLFEIDYIHSYELTEHCIIIARRKYINDTLSCVKYGAITYEGKIILPIDYCEIKRLRKADYFVIQRTSSAMGLYNCLGEEILPINYYGFIEHHSCLSFNNKKYNSNIGLYFFESNSIIMPQYEFIEPLYENVLVKLNGKWGILSPKGEYLLSPMFDEIFDISQGKQFLTKLGNEYIIYTSDLEQVHIGNYEYIKVITSNPFSYKYCKIKLYDKEDTYLYVPTLHTFVKGKKLSLLKEGKFQYQTNDDLQWYDITEDMYGNVWKITDLYSYE